MGRAIAHRIRGMNRTAKISLVLIFTLVFSTFMPQGLYKPKEAKAAITQPTAWTSVNDTNPNTTNVNVTSSGSFTAGGSAGTGRVLLVAFEASTSAAAQFTITNPTVTFGGVTVNRILDTRDATAYRTHLWVGYVLDANILTGARTVNVQFTSTGANVNSLKIFCATFAGVNQSTVTSGSAYNVLTASNTASGTISLPYAANDQPILLAGNSVSSSISTYTPGAGAYVTPPALSVNANTATFAVENRVIPGSASAGENTSCTMANSGRIAILGFSLKMAADLVNVTDGTDPAGYTVYPNETNKVANGFTMATNANTAQVTAVAASLSNSANISGIRLYRDAGTIGTYDAGVDTLISTGTVGATVNFTGLTENITTTATNYLIVVDVSSSATQGQTVVATVTSLTVTSPDSQGTITDSGSTLTIGAPCTRVAPTVTLGAYGNVSAGGTKIYTVTVTNNDSATCPSSTFTLSVASETGNTGSFTLPSAIAPATTGPLAPGAVYNGSTLTVVARASSSVGHALITTVNASDATNHAVLTGSGTVITTVTVTGAADMMHNSTNLNSTKWGAGGWGIPGGKYGEFTCATCHSKTTTNIKRVKTSITAPNAPTDNFPGSTVNFQTVTAANGFGDNNTTHATSSKVCEVCHTQTAYHKYNQTAVTHEMPNGDYDCTYCHPHYQGFKALGCINCHAKQQGTRAAVIGQFAGSSHHVQGVTLTNQHCYQCHWEANSDGTINKVYHGGWLASGSAVDLVIYGAGTRPAAYTLGTTAVAYTANGTRAELTKINQVCLGCHDDDSATAQPFGDGKTPEQYAWDGSSVANRYSQAGTTTWGKYTNTVTYPNAATKNVTKAYSAHGNAAANQRGWNTTTGYDSTPPNTSGSVQVLCFDCHNSHGSTVAGTTTSYAAGSGVTNGGILKDTVAGRGGYTVTYKPATSAATTATLVKHSAGADLCFDCHLTSNAMGGTPWSYDVTFGSSQILEGYVGKPGWAGAAGVNPSGAQQRYAYKNLIPSRGSHFEPSSSLTHASAPASSTINGLCTPCHDPHGVTTNTAVISAANKPYAVPLLKGTWMTSPYKEDTAPLATNLITGQSAENRTGCPDCSFNSPYNQRSEPGYHIDQNTFSTTNLTANPPNWDWNITTTHPQPAEAVSQFGGLCLNCHAQANINPNSSTVWKSFDRIHNTVKGWGGVGANANNAVHAFTCSKCHTPHHSSLPRLMISNCVDYKHRGRVGSGGTAGIFDAPSPNPGRDGAGRGRYPSGGGGHGNNPRDRGPYYFGETGSGSTPTLPPLVNCHNVAGAGGTGYPDSQLWNQKTPW